MIKKIKQRGSVLALVLVAGTFFLVVFTGLLGYVGGQRHVSVKKTQREQAFNIAEAGIEMYRWHVASQLNGRTAAQIADYWLGVPLGVPSYDREYRDPQGKAVGQFSLEVTPPQEGSTIIEVQSTGWHYDNPEVKRKIKARLRKPAWSEYVVVANDIMRFGQGTEIWGPIHSNNGIRFDGIAHNVISSSKQEYWDPDTGSMKDGVWTAMPDPSQVFLAGTDFPVAVTDFTGMIGNLAEMKAQAQIYLDPYSGLNKYGYHLILKDDGTMDVYKVTSRGSSSHHINSESFYKNYPLPDSGVIFVEDDATIEGEISDKKITIACADLETGSDYSNIYIEKDITYAGYDGSEMLGLIAQGDITVGLYSEDDLRIDGALVAQNGRIGRDYYNFWTSWQYYKRDTITIFGALATNQRYGFAWVCGGTVYCSGYEYRNIEFDPELMYNTPPYFPTQNEYQLDLWEEEK
ncbi:MAG: hypothetical protein ABIC19_00225 [Patescibacteria group bacterium]|nr:hypothetical protein [Patescibacteria group bacterium]